MHRLERLSSLLIMLVVIPIIIQGQVKPDAQLLKASFLMQQKNFKAAESTLINKPESSFDARFFYQLRGECRFALGDYQGAKSDFTWLEQNNYPGEAAYSLSRIAWVNGDRKQAYFYLKQHLTSKDKHPFEEIIRDTVFRDLDRDRDWISFWSKDWYTSFDDLLAEANYQLKSDFPDALAFSKLTGDFQD